LSQGRPIVDAVGMRALACVAALALVIGCKHRRDETSAPSGLAAGVEKITIDPAPEHLRGRVALPSGARVYARPTYTSASWELTLPDPPLSHADSPPRARAVRVVGIVRMSDPSIGASVGGSGEFLAVTNDLDGEDPNPPIGCGQPLDDLDHLRMLVYVPKVHLAEVTTRSLELEPFVFGGPPELLRIGAGARVSAGNSMGGLPALEPGVRWRWVDADGIRSLAPIPDDAVGLAWDPALVPKFGDAGEALMRDAEGSTIWLRDEFDGGDAVELTLRNACAEHRSRIDEPAKVASWRALALDVFYEQRPPAPLRPVIEADADYRIPAGTPLRWTDGDFAGELLADWSVAIGVGQTWDNRRCFALPLGSELVTVSSPAFACVDPNALVLLSTGAGFGVSDELARGGSIELGPIEVLDGGPWNDQAMQVILNHHHGSVSECLRPLVLTSERLEASRWDLQLDIAEGGFIDAVEVTARGPSTDAVEDCLRAEVYTWPWADGPAGRARVPLTLGRWTPEHEAAVHEPPAATQPDSKSKPKPKPGPKPAPKPEAKPGPGTVVVIDDDDDDDDEFGE
jgi:hypothetical protein